MGENDCAGVKFLVTGVIQTGDDFSAHIADIRVGRRCQRLHLLYGLTGSAQDGQRVGSLLLHYADG